MISKKRERSFELSKKCLASPVSEKEGRFGGGMQGQANKTEGKRRRREERNQREIFFPNCDMKSKSASRFGT